METFTLSGTINDTPRSITWTDGVFDDPSNATLDLIAVGSRVELTPTGPFYKAAARPADTALATAIAVFDSWPQMDDAAENIFTGATYEPDAPAGAVY